MRRSLTGQVKTMSFKYRKIWRDVSSHQKTPEKSSGGDAVVVLKKKSYIVRVMNRYWGPPKKKKKKRERENSVKLFQQTRKLCKNLPNSKFRIFFFLPKASLLVLRWHFSPSVFTWSFLCAWLCPMSSPYWIRVTLTSSDFNYL